MSPGKNFNTYIHVKHARLMNEMTHKQINLILLNRNKVRK